LPRQPQGSRQPRCSRSPLVGLREGPVPPAGESLELKEPCRRSYSTCDVRLCLVADVDAEFARVAAEA